MSTSAFRLATRRNERSTRPALRSVLLAALDNRSVLVVFGTLLPLVLAILAKGGRPPTGFSPSAPRIRFSLLGPELMTLLIVLALSFMIWVSAKPRGPGLVRLFAVVLSLGTALAMAYAGVVILLWALGLLNLLGIADAGWSSMQAIVLLVVLIPAPLIAVLYFRQASLAWAESGAPARRHPHATVLGIVAFVALVYTLTMWGGRRAAEVGLERLRAAPTHAVEDALGPLRIAALMGGEARLYNLYDDSLDAATAARLDQAYLRVTGRPPPLELRFPARD